MKIEEQNHKKFWQRFARLYGPFMEKSSRKLYGDICRWIQPDLSRDMNVLELACGTGQLSIPLCSRVRLWEATDFSEAMIAEAKKRKSSFRLHFSVQDATKLPYAPDSFDAVVIANALHIMPHPEEALAEIRRVLKPEGKLYAPTFVLGEGTGFHLKIRALGLMGFHAYHLWSEEEFARYVSENGFAVTGRRILGGGLEPVCCLAARKIS